MTANYVKTGKEDLKEINLMTEEEKKIYMNMKKYFIKLLHEKGLSVVYSCPID